MPKLNKTIDQAVEVTSPTFSKERILEMLATDGIFFAGHFEYPVSVEGKQGNHLDAIFVIESIAKNDKFVEWIVDDLITWIDERKIAFDAIFAPAQPAVMAIVNQLAQRTGKRAAFWEYLPEGWFGTRIVQGEIKPGDRVLVYNGVSQQGRCVGQRLPEFVAELGGKTVAAAVFAKGTGVGVKAAEERYGDKFYSALAVDIEIASPDKCQFCFSGKNESLEPWTKRRASL